MATKYIKRAKLYGVWYPVKDIEAAPINSPNFTGTPKAPTPASTDSSTKIATTAFVKDLVQYLAPLASPGFTGTPTAPTPDSSDSSTKIATTAFVQALIQGLANEIHASIFETWSGTSVEPESGKVYRHASGSINSAVINLPANPANGFICEVDFSASSSFTGVTVKKGAAAYDIKVAGSALNVGGKRYNIIIWWDGVYYCCASQAF